jgi:ribokinase
MITVFGSIGMDLLFSLPHLPAVGETVLTPTYTRAMGGKGANQAVAAARDGGTVRFVGSVGGDGFGNEARSLLQAEGIDLTGFATVDAATCVASVCFDTQGRNQIAVASGANLLTTAEALRPEILASDDWLVLQMEIPSGEVSKAVAIAKARSARVILNLAPALPIEVAALRKVDVLVLNEHEASLLCTHIGLAPGSPALLAGPISRLLGTTVIGWRKR